jgi:UDP-3-O-[3-hydroxymyristoyl] glucosamine N-acyltransferase
MPLLIKRAEDMTNYFGGRVVIKDNVGIGLCTIDKGVTGDTTIGEGTKLTISTCRSRYSYWKKCLIASQTGIAGCVIIEDEVTIWGQVETQVG